MHHGTASAALSHLRSLPRFAGGIVTLMLAVVAVACGDESSSSASSPTGPSATPAPSVSSLRIDGVDAVRTGLSADYTATVTLSNGTTQSVSPTWTSSNASAATVDGNGRVTGQSHGQTTLTATHQGVSATKAVSVVSNFGGQWSGRFVMRTCDQSGVFAVVEYCQGLGGVGSTGPITLSVAQSGADQSQLSGAISFGGSLTGNVTGNVSSDGRMQLAGSFNVVSSGLTFTFRVGGWESRLSGQSSMTGRWADNLAAVNVPGNAYTENELLTMTRVSTSEVPSSAPQTVHVEWRELFESMRRPPR